MATRQSTTVPSTFEKYQNFMLTQPRGKEPVAIPASESKQAARAAAWKEIAQATAAQKALAKAEKKSKPKGYDSYDSYDPYYYYSYGRMPGYSPRRYSPRSRW